MGVLLAGATAVIAVSAASAGRSDATSIKSGPSAGSTGSSSTAPLSSFTKVGVDQATGSTAAASTGTPGSAHPGDRIKWVLNYTNTSGAAADLHITDPITGSQSYVADSLRTPPNLTGSVNGSTITATGTVQDGTTGARSPAFRPSNIDFHTLGGDGYTVEGFGGNVYTVFHHNDGISWAGEPLHDQTVFCATLDNQVCPGWPSYATFVDPKAGTPLGTGTDGQYVTAGTNGSLIVNGRLYWPVQHVKQPHSGNYDLGMQCLDLTTLRSCGFTFLAPSRFQASGSAYLGGDGIAASDGHYYYFDGNGDLLCFEPETGACGTFGFIGGVWDATMASVGTYGDHVFVLVPDYLTHYSVLSCFDIHAGSTCPGYPKAVGQAALIDFPGELMPVLSPTGMLEGACAVFHDVCFDLSGTPISNNPYSQLSYASGDNASAGYGTGVALGAKYYTMVDADHVGCFDFSLPLSGGKVQPCADFTERPRTEAGYTVRPLANLPGCLASAGDHRQIAIFDAATGAPCSTRAQMVKLSPSEYYCDGQEGHATSWGSVTLPGLDGSEYTSATLTLYGADGNAVSGWDGVAFPAGSSSIPLSSLLVTGNTATLTAQVTLTGVKNAGAVGGTGVRLTWRGDPIQVCYETVVAPLPCLSTTQVSNTANAVTTAGAVTDAPAGRSSGPVVFDVSQPNGACRLHFSKTASSTVAMPGQRVQYTITVTNTGTVDYSTAHPAQFIDDLSDVLADANYRNDARASGGTVSYDASTKRLSWTGPLAAGASATITYSVVVDHPDRGDHQMINRVTSTNHSNCEPGSVDKDCVVVVNVPGLIVSKSVKPGNFRTVHPGDVLSYELAFQDVGRGDAPVDYVDDMRDVLDDGDVVAQPVASDSALHVTTIKDGKFAVTGALAGGQTVTVRYSVKVKAYNDERNHRLDNFLVPSGSTHGSHCTRGNPLCTHNPVPADHGTSGEHTQPKQPTAFTGFNSQIAMVIASLLLGVGGLLILGGMRRRAVRQAGGEADN